MNILKSTELYTLKWEILEYVNYIIFFNYVIKKTICQK